MCASLSHIVLYQVNKVLYYYTIFYSLFFVNHDKLTTLVSFRSLKKLFALDPEVFCGINMVLSTATFSCETQQA